MRFYALLVYVFLYAPIAFIVAGSFNAGRNPMVWQGFSLEWYGKAFANPLIMEALRTSLFIALANAILAAAIGTQNPAATGAGSAPQVRVTFTLDADGILIVGEIDTDIEVPTA